MVYSVEYQCKKEINAIQIGNSEYYCFSLDKYINGNKVSHSEGFTKNPQITETENIKTENGVYLFKKDVLDVNLNTCGGFYGLDNDKQREYIQSNPYTFMSENPDWEEDFIVLNYYLYSGDLLKLNGIYCPKAITFSDINIIDNERYDLDKVLEFVKSDKHCILCHNEILDIPWYNRTETSYQYVNFIFRPTEKEYNDARNLKRDLNSYALELLNLDRFRIN